MKVIINEKQLQNIGDFDKQEEKDEYSLGCEQGGGYMHITESYGRGNIDFDNVNKIEFETYADEDDMNEELANNEDMSKEEWLRDNVQFDIDFYDLDYEYIGRASVYYSDLLDHYTYEGIPDEMIDLVLAEFNRKPDFFDGRYSIDDIAYNLWSECDDIYEAAKHLFATSEEYYQGMHGFCLQDGTIILMGAGSDHNEVTSLKGIETKWQFVEMGNPSFYANSLRVGNTLTSQQEEVIGRMIRSYSDDELYVSFLGGPKGEQTCKYTNPNYRRVFADIDRYYNEGIIPLGEAKKKKETLKESVSSVVYHYTTMENLACILEDDEFRLSYDYDKDLYSMCVTRQRNTTLGYASGEAVLHGSMKECVARITLDGELLNNNFKGKPINFFNTEGGKKNAKINDPQKYVESEERIYSYDETIPNALRYVLRIDVIFRKEPKWYEDTYYPQWVQDLLEFNFINYYFEEADANKYNSEKLRNLLGNKWKNGINGEEVLMVFDEAFYEEEEYLDENVEYEVKPSEVDLSSFEIEDTLAPNIWDGTNLNSRVRLKLLDIADDFIETLNISWVKPKDIILTGSICNYNWSEYSDIDLHVLIDFNEVDERTEFVQEYFNSKKNQWNDEHTDLKIYDFPIELYVQDVNAVNVSSGIYSLQTNEWLSEPRKNEISDLSEEEEMKVKIVSSSIMTLIDDLCEEFINTEDLHKIEEIGDEVSSLAERLKGIRSNGLEKNGEMSVGNIVYKEIRRMGYFDKLWDLSTKVYDKLNSI